MTYLWKRLNQIYCIKKIFLISRKNRHNIYFEDEDEIKEEKDTEIKEEPKIVDKVVGCDIEKCFKGTIKYKPGQDNDLIKDIIDEKNKEHKRIFYKNNKRIGYIEVFQNPQLTFAYQISNKISFLFESIDGQKIIFNEKKCFGFRYYNSKNEYCTLLKIGDKDIDNYAFLEKINKENEFYDETFDCFSIVYEAIFSKYKEGNNDFHSIIKEGPLYEVLGFSYAILFKSTEFIRFHKPHTNDILNIKDFTNYIPYTNNDKLVNIIPLLFDGHISILFFVDKNNKRGYILSDPSHIHSHSHEEISYINGYIFPKNMRKNMLLFPEKKIQKYNSCSLWFYFQMLILINYDKNSQKEYKTAKNIISSIMDLSIYFECINYYQKLFGFKKNLIEIIHKFDQFDQDYIYFIPPEEFTLLNKVKIYKYAFLNQFVDLIQLFEIKTKQEIDFKNGIKEIKLFQKYLEDFIDYILPYFI